MYQVITFNKITGMHYWENAPDKFKYLSYPHRHEFYIRCWFDVADPDREIEINEQQYIIESTIKERYMNHRGEGVFFGGMSCENIAEYCIDVFGCAACEVLEDGFGGAYVRK